MSNFHLLNENMKNCIIKKLGWTELTSVQEKSIPEILDGKNLIILAPTAGGKTEAAFFPILSKVADKKLQPVSVLYISPIKALLNNQEERLKELSSFIYGDVFKWHGDVERGEKNKFFNSIFIKMLLNHFAYYDGFVFYINMPIKQKYYIINMI